MSVWEKKVEPVLEYIRIILLLLSLSTGLIADFIWEYEVGSNCGQETTTGCRTEGGLPPRIFIIWFTITLFAWSILAIRQMKKVKSEKDTLYAVVGILLASWYITKMITLKEKPTGNFAANCRKDELIVGTIIPTSIGIYAAGYFLSSI